jgi:hypothetical protein
MKPTEKEERAYQLCLSYFRAGREDRECPALPGDPESDKIALHLYGMGRERREEGLVLGG